MSTLTAPTASFVGGRLVGITGALVDMSWFSDEDIPQVLELLDQLLDVARLELRPSVSDTQDARLPNSFQAVQRAEKVVERLKFQLELPAGESEIPCQQYFERSPETIDDHRYPVW